MKTLTYNEIYKIYKHGGNLNDIDIDEVFEAFSHFPAIQTVMVADKNKKARIYNFVPETGRFCLICQEK